MLLFGTKLEFSLALYFSFLETTTEMISATDRTDDCFECSFVSDMIHSEIARVLPAAFLVASSWVVKLSDIWNFIWVGGLVHFFLLEMSVEISSFSFQISPSQSLKLSAL